MNRFLSNMKIAIIGAGAMGGAVASGLIENVPGTFGITVSNPSAGPLDHLKGKGATVTHDNCEAIAGADLIIIAVKPWIVQTVIEEIKDRIDFVSQTVAVIAAGISGEQLSDWFRRGDAVPQLLIAMPNTAMTVGESMTFLVPVTADAEKTAEVGGVFDLLGKTQIIDEAHLPAATALASCGIAYAMRYVRAAMEGGVELGFKASVAQQMICQTLRGAVTLLEQPCSHPESEIDKVTTPGGITIKGLNEMEHAGFTSAVIRGLKASVK